MHSNHVRLQNLLYNNERRMVRYLNRNVTVYVNFWKGTDCKCYEKLTWFDATLFEVLPVRKRNCRHSFGM